MLSHWRQLNDLSDLTEKNPDEQKALKHLKAAFHNDLAFIDSFLQDLNTFQSRLLEHFMQPFKITFQVFFYLQYYSIQMHENYIEQQKLPIFHNFEFFFSYQIYA